MDLALLRAALAEWQVVRVRLLRTRLGLWLLLLGGGLTALTLGQPAPALAPFTVRVGMLAAILAVAFGAGSDVDRASLTLTLSHPTTPLAVAAGRWLAGCVVAGVVVLAAGSAVAWHSHAGVTVIARAFAAGCGAAGAAAGCALALAWLGGNALVGGLFVCTAVLSGVAPAPIEAYFAPSLWRSAFTLFLRIAPALWRYDALAGAGTLGGRPVTAWAHAVAWVSGGVLVAAWRLARRLR